MLSGMLNPRDYRTVEVNFICDLLNAMFDDVKSIDENLNAPDGHWESNRVVEVLL
eukprot:SAG31_NODE_39768_length_285_cov_1.392473_2_plen_54_part_01